MDSARTLQTALEETFENLMILTESSEFAFGSSHKVLLKWFSNAKQSRYLVCILVHSIRNNQVMIMHKSRLA